MSNTLLRTLNVFIRPIVLCIYLFVLTVCQNKFDLILFYLRYET